MKEQRRDPRRTLPYMRSAVLEAGGRNHIVTVTDLSVSGAFLATRVAVDPDQPLRLRVILPGASRESVIPCRFVRWGKAATGGESGRPFGLGIRFDRLEEGDLRLLEDFLASGEPDPETDDPETPSATPDRFEYVLLERDALDEDELNRLGAAGWVVAGTLPRAVGVQLVLRRRL